MDKKNSTTLVDRLELIDVHPVDSKNKAVKSHFYSLRSGFFTENVKSVVSKFKSAHKEIINEQKRDSKNTNLKPIYLEYKKFDIKTTLLCIKVSDFFFNVPIKRGYILLDFLNETFYRLSKSELAEENISFNVGDILEKTDTGWKLIYRLKVSDEFTEIDYNKVLEEVSNYYFWIKEAKLCKTCKNTCKQAFEIHQCNLFLEK